ncbi:MAG: hypothetical protein JRJ87_21705 [Deltaproteobacteria bacterium]|nr:hypothetical protein [Deltaproteobacteria bacterium]
MTSLTTLFDSNSAALWNCEQQPENEKQPKPARFLQRASACTTARVAGDWIALGGQAQLAGGDLLIGVKLVGKNQLGGKEKRKRKGVRS